MVSLRKLRGKYTIMKVEKKLIYDNEIVKEVPLVQKSKKIKCYTSKDGDFFLITDHANEVLLKIECDSTQGIPYLYVDENFISSLSE